MNLEQISTQTTPQNPPGNVIMGIIIFLAVIGAAVGGLSIVRNVRSPFFVGAGSTAPAAIDTTEQAQAAQRAENLKTQDTDGDGISDFDELYTYKTSPYLKDTDSDGFDDKTEIASGHDPNCPEGQNCSRQDLAEKPTDGKTQIGLPDVFKGIQTGSSIDQALTAGVDLTPDQIRTLLRQKGMTDDQLSKFDDQTLLQTYKDSIAEVKQKQSATSTTGVTTMPSTASTPPSLLNASTIPVASPSGTSGIITDYSQLTAQQIRDMAISSGLVTKEQLSQIDDATLKDLFIKSVNTGATP